MLRDFLTGVLKGARETPVGFFAPAVAVWRLLVSTTESLLGGDKARYPQVNGVAPGTATG